MPPRIVFSFVVMALLFLSVGFGSALLLSRASPGGKKQIEPPATPSASVPVSPTTPGEVEGPASPTETQESVVTASTDKPTSTLARTPTSGPTETLLPTLPPERYGGPVTMPNNHKGPRWVTLQAGHWRNQNMPEELQHLSNNTGASAAGINEVDVNVQI